MNSSTNNEKSFLSKLWGEPGWDGVLLGMWSFHYQLISPDAATRRDAQKEQWQNQAIAITYHGIFGGTFINSFNDRCYSFGFQRDVLQWGDISSFSTNLGYRLGFVYGYDSRMSVGRIADNSKLLPYLQIIYDVGWKWFGFESSFVGVLTGGFFIRAYLD